MIGIVIPVSSAGNNPWKKGETRLGHTLSYIKQRTTVPYKVVVSSLDGGYEDIAGSYGAEQIITHATLSTAKNLGAARLYDCDVLCFIDAHCKLDIGWDKTILEALKDDTVGIATLRTYTLRDDFTENRGQGGDGYKFAYNFKRTWTSAKPNGEIGIINGAFQCFRKETFFKIGGFIPFHDEDWAISIASARLGYRNVCVPKAQNGSRVEVGHVFKGAGSKVGFCPMNDYAEGQILISYLHFPEHEYSKVKAKHSAALVSNIEKNFENLKKFVEENSVKSLRECFRL